MGSRHCLQKWSAIEETGQTVGGMHEGVIITGISASLPLSGGTKLKDRTGQAICRAASDRQTPYRIPYLSEVHIQGGISDCRHQQQFNNREGSQQRWKSLIPKSIQSNCAT